MYQSGECFPFKEKKYVFKVENVSPLKRKICIKVENVSHLKKFISQRRKFFSLLTSSHIWMGRICERGMKISEN
jgi:hypothetical protein